MEKPSITQFIQSHHTPTFNGQFSREVTWLSPIQILTGDWCKMFMWHHTLDLSHSLPCPSNDHGHHRCWSWLPV